MTRSHDRTKVTPIVLLVLAAIFIVFAMIGTLATNRQSRSVDRSFAQIAGAHPTRTRTPTLYRTRTPTTRLSATRTRTPTLYRTRTPTPSCLRNGATCQASSTCCSRLCIGSGSFGTCTVNASVTPTRTRTPTRARTPTPTLTCSRVSCSEVIYKAKEYCGSYGYWHQDITWGLDCPREYNHCQHQTRTENKKYWLPQECADDSVCDGNPDCWNGGGECEGGACLYPTWPPNL